jgi:dTMP kinase
LTFEPGATRLGRGLRRLLLEVEPEVGVEEEGDAGLDGDAAPDPEGVAPSARAEALLMAADRAQHVDRIIRPALAAGRWVVTDRYGASTLAYQGAGRGLDETFLRSLVAWATEGVDPDLSILVDVPADEAGRRISSSRPDRLERLDVQFFERVRARYHELARQNPGRWLVVDGRQPVDVVTAVIVRGVRDRVGWPDGVRS